MATSSTLIPPALSGLRHHWFVAARSRDVRQAPFAAAVLGLPVALVRLEGRVEAFVDRCPHRGVALSGGRVRRRPEGERLECPYHGWRFGPGGACAHVPGLGAVRPHPARAAEALPVVERDGLIWVRPSSEGGPQEPPRSPFFGAARLRTWTVRTRFEGALLDVLENLLDGTHTHFVHAGVIRSDGPRQRVRATVRREADRAEVRYAGEGRQSGLISQLFERERSESFGRFVMPSIGELEYRSSRGTEFGLTAHFTPRSEDEHDAWVTLAARGPRLGTLKLAAMAPLLALAAAQDRRITAAQRANVARFGGPRYRSTAADLMRPQIEAIWRGDAEPARERRRLMLL